MGIFDWFRRPPPIAGRDALLDFLDSRAAFLAQKTIFDYVRALSGTFFSQLMKEKAFHEAVDVSRWHNYPVTVSLVAEMLHGAMLSAAGRPQPLADALTGLSLDAFDRYPVPPVLDSEAWMQSRSELASRVAAVALHPPKRVMDIATPAIAERIFKAMPVHERMLSQDTGTIKNLLSVNLIRMHDDFSARADLSVLIAELGLHGDENVSSGIN